MDIDTILDQVISHAAASGYFERVNGHEPKSAPGNGLTAAVWVDRIEPINVSGLANTSGRVTVNVRLYTSFIGEPQDAIDPNLVKAMDALLTAYAGHFTLGANVRCVDIRGMAGVKLTAQAGYLTVDRTVYRVITITIPILVNDLWPEAA